MDALKSRGLIVGVASNYNKRLRPVLAGLPIVNSVDEVVISSEIGWRKPAPEFFAALVRRSGFAAEQVLYVGNEPVNDYEAANAARLQPVLLDPRGQFSPAYVRIRDLAELCQPYFFGKRMPKE